MNLADQGKFNDAESLLQEVLVTRENIEGKEHPHTLATAKSLGAAMIGTGKFKEAEKLLIKNLVLMKRVLGMEHTHTLISMRHLASALREQGKHLEAEHITCFTSESAIQASRPPHQL